MFVPFVQHKFFLIAFIVGMLLLGFSTTDISQAKMTAHSFNTSGSTYTGNVTIEPNGSLQGPNPGTIPITQSGNSYILDGEINGTLTILHSGAVLNGQNYSVSPYYASQIGAITVMNASHVQVANFIASSANPNSGMPAEPRFEMPFEPSSGVFLNNTSNDMINNVASSSHFFGFHILENVHNINISNSVAHSNFFNMYVGGEFLSSLSQGTLESSNITIYNFTSFGSSTGLVLGAEYSKVLDSKFSGSGIALTSAANNTLFSGNSLNVSSTMTGFLSNMFVETQSPHNVTFKDNTLYGSSTSVSPPNLIAFENTAGVISGNKINVNASGMGANGIYLLNGHVAVTHNVVNITDVGSSSSTASSGIAFTGNNYTITGNVVNLTGGNSSGIAALPGPLLTTPIHTDNVTISENTLDMNVTGGYGILLNATDTLVSGNVVKLNSTMDPITGIALSGFNDIINGNSVALSFDKVNPGLANGIGNIGVPGNFGNLSINGNAVTFEFPHVSLFNSSYFVGINYRGNSASGLSIIGNTVTGPVLSGLAGTPSVIGSVKTGLQVSHNTIYGTGGILGTGNNTTISFNNISYINPGIGFGGYHSSVNDAHIFDNTLNCLRDGTFGIDGELQGNLSITGNYFYGRVIDVGLLGGVSNATVYHNDFFNASAVPIEIVDSIGVANTNISLNASYPVGGNYYAAFAGTDLHSGPLQNLNGSDGIFDTSYTPDNAGIADKYPLAKPWLRPQFTVYETGLLNGAVWSATFNGHTKTSDGTSISFNIVNATYQTYSYSYAAVNGYVGSGSGTYSYTGANSTSSTAKYTPVYEVNFTESGLPAGSAWQVSVNGTLHNVSAQYIDIAVNNGTSISYYVHNSTDYYTSNGNGQFTVTGNTTLNIAFHHYAYLVGNLLPSAANIMVNGLNVTVSNGHFNVSLTGGSYEVVVTDSGYTSYYSNITLRPGQTYSLNVSLNGTGSNGFTARDYEYMGIGSVGAVVVGLGAYMFRKKR